MNKPTIMTVVGTRPEIIRLSRLIPKFDENFNHVLIHTGQNYDPMLSDIFFQELRIRKPDSYLNVDHSSLGRTLGDLFIKFEEVLLKYNPDGVFILGDTNSSLVAILAKRFQIPVYHWEAGNRSFDENVPEETNRVIVDHTAHFNIAYSYPAEANLIAEGISESRVLMSGSPMKEILDFYQPDIEASQILEKLGLVEKKFFVASIHRQENVDNPARLKVIIDSLSSVSTLWNIPVLLSTHPRTANRLEKLKIKPNVDGLIFSEPIGYFDYIKLQKKALCVISDSGTISEESAILNFPAVTPRTKIERPEALAAGTIILSTVDSEGLINAVSKALKNLHLKPPSEYLQNDASSKVFELVISTVSNYSAWSGVSRLQGGIQ